MIVLMKASASNSCNSSLIHLLPGKCNFIFYLNIYTKQSKLRDSSSFQVLMLKSAELGCLLYCIVFIYLFIYLEHLHLMTLSSLSSLKHS